MRFFCFTEYIYYCNFFCSVPALRICERHRHGWVRYIDTKQIKVLRFLWDHLFFFTQYSYYRDFFCSGTALSLWIIYRHVWVRYIDTAKIAVLSLSLLLLSIDLLWFCYFIVFYFRLTNGAMVKWWIVKWCNGEIKIRGGSFLSQKYLICSFILFLNTKIS